MLENTTGEGGSFAKLKLIAEQWPTQEFPTFTKEVKNEAGEYVLGDSFNRITWTVVSIKTTHNGKTGKQEVKGFQVEMKDGDETYVLESTMKHASKELANTALVNIGNVISVSPYLNKAQYPTLSIRLNGKDGDWAKGKYEYEELLTDLNPLWDDIKAQENTTANEAVTLEDCPF